MGRASLEEEDWRDDGSALVGEGFVPARRHLGFSSNAGGQSGSWWNGNGPSPVGPVIFGSKVDGFWVVVVVNNLLRRQSHAL